MDFGYFELANFIVGLNMDSSDPICILSSFARSACLSPLLENIMNLLGSESPGGNGPQR